MSLRPQPAGGCVLSSRPRCRPTATLGPTRETARTLVHGEAAPVAFRGDQGGAKLSWAPAPRGAPWARRRLGDHGAVRPL